MRPTDRKNKKDPLFALAQALLYKSLRQLEKGPLSEEINSFLKATGAYAEPSEIAEQI